MGKLKNIFVLTLLLCVIGNLIFFIEESDYLRILEELEAAVESENNGENDVIPSSSVISSSTEINLEHILSSMNKTIEDIFENELNLTKSGNTITSTITIWNLTETEDKDDSLNLTESGNDFSTKANIVYESTTENLDFTNSESTSIWNLTTKPKELESAYDIGNGCIMNENNAYFITIFMYITQACFFY